MRIFSICLTVLAVVCAVVAAFGFTVLAMAKDGAAYDGGEFQDSFISASELHSERKAVARLRQACDESEGRLTYSCFCENAAGSQLQFDEAFRDRVANRVRESASMNRLALAGMTSGGLLMGVASLCGLFRVRVARKNLR